MSINHVCKLSSPAGIFHVATACKALGDRAHPIALYRRGLALIPDRIDGLLNLGVLLAEQAQYDEAIGQRQHLLRCLA